MPRQARIKSCTDMYHIMLRGINKQQIFEDRYDYIQFIKTLYEVIPVSNYELHAYCLMGNHIHLLIKACGEPLPQIMKRISVRFVGWYNKKYDRHGHLFENRYRSEPVEDSAYYLSVIRYILQNPVKAGMCNNIFDYPWSSAQSYFNPIEKIISQDIRSHFPNSDSLLNFLTKPSDDSFLENENRKSRQPSMTDEYAHSIFFSVTGCKSASDFQSLAFDQRKLYVHRLVKKIPVGFIARYTGYSKANIYRIKNKKKGTDTP